MARCFLHEEKSIFPQTAVFIFSTISSYLELLNFFFFNQPWNPTSQFTQPFRVHHRQACRRPEKGKHLRRCSRGGSCGPRPTSNPRDLEKPIAQLHEAPCLLSWEKGVRGLAQCQGAAAWATSEPLVTCLGRAASESSHHSAPLPLGGSRLTGILSSKSFCTVSLTILPKIKLSRMARCSFNPDNLNQVPKITNSC